IGSAMARLPQGVSGSKDRPGATPETRRAACTYVHHNSPPASPSPLPRQGQRSGYATSASSSAGVLVSRHPGGRMLLVDAYGSIGHMLRVILLVLAVAYVGCYLQCSG